MYEDYPFSSMRLPQFRELLTNWYILNTLFHHKKYVILGSRSFKTQIVLYFFLFSSYEKPCVLQLITEALFERLEVIYVTPLALFSSANDFVYTV